MRRLIIFVHRYVGIPMSIVFVVWFISGIVMMYTGGMPELSDADRLRGEGRIDLDAVTVSPAEAARRAGIEGPVNELSLGNLLGRPAYRVGRGFGSPVTVFADTGDVFGGADPADALAESARFIGQPPSALRFAGTATEPDQWTMILSRSLPLERFDADDGHATRVYFSLSTGRVELVTERADRLLAWAGAIPHWFYFTPLRLRQPLWYWTVVWVSAVGCVLAVLGLVLAFTQFRRSKPFRLATSIRYRGLMRWHYYTGALFGLFALTWVFSGLMSMEPFDWTRTEGMAAPRTGLEGGPLDLERYPLEAMSLAAAGVLAAAAPFRIELTRILGEPFYSVTQAEPDGAMRQQLVDPATFSERTEPFSGETILAALESTVTDAKVTEHEVLDRYDAYYYAQDGAAPLPVLRVKFDDPAATWFYFDLMTLGPVAANHRLSRIERWLFNGLHSLDFGFWYDRRPFWDLGLILLSLGALATSAIGVVLGYRRLSGRARREQGTAVD
jgi:hypothetical protein